jgi:hypothetical protein
MTLAMATATSPLTIADHHVGVSAWRALELEMLDALQHGVVLADATRVDNPIVYANSAFLELTGYARDELLGQPYTALLDTAADPNAFENLLAALAARAPFAGELLTFRKDGTTFWHALSINPFRPTPDGDVTHFVVSGVDGSAQRVQGELEQKRRKLERLGTLAAGVSHDVKNVLAVVGAISSLLEAEVEGNEGACALLTELNSAVEKGSVLTRRLLDSGFQEPRGIRSADVSEVVADVCRMVERVLPPETKIHLSVPEETALIQADVSEIEQIALNLVINARDAMRDGGTIAVDVARTPSHVILTVADTGEGMTEETARRLFEPFFTTKPQGKGTGIGLSIVHGLVSQLGGEISVASELGRGATFVIRLPRVRLH